MQPIKLDPWVNDNNPDHSLSYSKGWWDFIEYVRRMAWLLELEDHQVTVVDTFELHTPPPQEVLISPIVRLGWDGVEVILKEDFGNVVGPEWTIGINSHRSLPDITPFLSLEQPFGANPQAPLMPGWEEQPYTPACQQCTVRAKTEWNAYGLLRLMRVHSRTASEASS